MAFILNYSHRNKNQFVMFILQDLHEDFTEITHNPLNQKITENTVDGWNPAPPGMHKTL